MIVDIVFKMFTATFFNLLRYFSIEKRKKLFPKTELNMFLNWSKSWLNWI